MSESGAADLEAHCRARLGSVLRGKWTLDELLGIGGMGAVYAGTHRNGSRVAIKMLHPQLALDRDSTRRFLREGYVANKVDHPSTVKVLDDDVTDDGVPFIVMELLDGEPLHSVLEQSLAGRLPPSEVLDMADQVLDQLAAAHDAGIVHRDLKPENLFVARGGAIRILDFGIARLRELSSKSNATEAGSVMGTPSYMPPEQALGYWDQVDGRSDLWALGAVMFTLLTGTLVHHAQKPCKTPNEELLAAMSRPAPPVRDIEPSVPPAVAQIVDRALRFEMGARFADARAMQSAIRAARSGDLRATSSGAATTATLASAREGLAAAPHPAHVEVVGAATLPASGATTAPVSSGALTPRAPKRQRSIVAPLAVVVAAGVGLGAVAYFSSPGSDLPASPSAPTETTPPLEVSPAGGLDSIASGVAPIDVRSGTAPDPATSASAREAAPPEVGPKPVAAPPPPPPAKVPPPPVTTTSPWSKWE